MSVRVYAYVCMCVCMGVCVTRSPGSPGANTHYSPSFPHTHYLSTGTSRVVEESLRSYEGQQVLKNEVWIVVETRRSTN